MSWWWSWRRTPQPAAPTASSSAPVTAASITSALGDATRVWLKSSVSAHVRFGSSTVVATAGDIPTSAGADYVLDIEPGTTHVAALRAASTSGTLYWTSV